MRSSHPDLLPAEVRVDAADLVGLRLSGARLSPIRLRPPSSPRIGTHGSQQRGRGMDYRESRHYQAGDDIRNMDWRITARAGRAHVKVFDEERERPVMLLLDLAPSMFFGTRGCFKSVQAARLAALLGWAAIAHGDRIGALMAGETLLELSPMGGRRGQMRLIRALVEAGDPRPVLHSGYANGMKAVDGSGQGFGQSPMQSSIRSSSASRPEILRSRLSDSLARLRRVARPGSLILLLSDFYRLDDAARSELSRLAQHCDILGIEILDPLELAPPPPGRYRFSDGWRKGLLDLGQRSARDRYSAHCAERQAVTALAMRQAGVPLWRCRTDQDPVQMLAEAMHPRRPGPSRSAAVGAVEAMGVAAG